MSEFFLISKSEGEPIGLNLRNLGQKVPFITIGHRKSVWSEESRQSSTTYYNETTNEDYDKLFAATLVKTKPPYEADKLLNYHLNYYLNECKGEKSRFIKHIKYVILPILQKRDPNSVFIELVNDWIKLISYNSAL